jgi:putative MFS transporter
MDVRITFNDYSDNELDNILEKTSFNMVHFNLFLLMIFFCTAIGYSISANSLVLPEIEKNWKLSETQKSLIGGSIFLGFMLGSALSGAASWRGRRFAFQLGLSISTFGSYFTIEATDPFGIIFYIFLIGTGFGICLPSANSLIAEICNSKLRSYILTYVWVTFPIGEIFACLIAEHFQIYLYKTENWRKVYLFRFFIILIVFPFTFLINDSPRYLLTVKKYEEAFSFLKDLMGPQKEHLLTEEKQNLIIVQYENYLEKNNLNEDNGWTYVFKFYAEIFSKKYLQTSVVIFSLWFIVSFLLYGFMFIIPTILQTLQNDKKAQGENITGDKYSNVIYSLKMTCLFEIPVILITPIFLNHKSIGRIGTIYIGFGMCTIFTLLCYFSPGNITFYASVYKAMNEFPFDAINIYTSEIFPTHIKAIALGLSEFFSRFGGFIAPFVVEALYQSNILLPFLSFGVVSLIGVLMALNLPHESLGIKNF